MYDGKRANWCWTRYRFFTWWWPRKTDYELKWNTGLLAKRRWDKAQLQVAVEGSVRSADMDVAWG